MAVVLLGLATSVTGLVLNFTNLLGTQWGLQPDVATKDFLRYALMVHGAVTVLFVGGLFGHIYMAVFAAPGALDGMLKGEIEENYVKAHHSVWYEEQKGEQTSVAE